MNESDIIGYIISGILVFIIFFAILGKIIEDSVRVGIVKADRIIKDNAKTEELEKQNGVDQTKKV